MLQKKMKYIMIILQIILVKGYRYAEVKTLKSTPGMYYEYVKPLQTIDKFMKFSLHVDLGEVQHNSSLIKAFIYNIHQCPDLHTDCKALIARNEYLLYLLTSNDNLLNSINILSKKFISSQPQSLPYPFTSKSFSNLEPNTDPITLSFSEITDLQHNLQNLLNEVLLEENYLLQKSLHQNIQYFIKVQSWTMTLEAYLKTQLSTYNLLIDIFNDILHDNLPSKLQHYLLKAYKAQTNSTAELYIDRKFLSVMLWKRNSVLSIEIELPTLNMVMYNVYKMYSIPTLLTNKKVIHIKLNHDYIIVNQGEYALIHANQLNECTTNMKRFICFRGFPTTQKHSCELKMLMEPVNSSAALCEIAVDQATGPHWIFLTHSNIWLFIVMAPTILYVQCQGTAEAILVSNYGLLSLHSGCSATFEGIQLTSTTTAKIRDIPIYSPNFNLTVDPDINGYAILAFIANIPITEVLLSNAALTCVNCIALIVISLLYCVTKCKNSAIVIEPVTDTPNPDLTPRHFEEPRYEIPRPIHPISPTPRTQPPPTYANF